jgi:hypothetical protein
MDHLALNYNSARMNDCGTFSVGLSVAQARRGHPRTVARLAGAHSLVIALPVTIPQILRDHDIERLLSDWTCLTCKSAALCCTCALSVRNNTSSRRDRSIEQVAPMDVLIVAHPQLDDLALNQKDNRTTSKEPRPWIGRRVG